MEPGHNGNLSLAKNVCRFEDSRAQTMVCDSVKQLSFFGLVSTT